MAVVKDKYRGTPSYQLVYEELLSAAKSRGTVTYKKIAQIMDLPYLSGNYMSGEVGQILGEIAEDEYDQNRPLLTAVAVLTSGGGRRRFLHAFSRTRSTRRGSVKRGGSGLLGDRARGSLRCIQQGNYIRGACSGRHRYLERGGCGKDP